MNIHPFVRCDFHRYDLGLSPYSIDLVIQIVSACYHYIFHNNCSNSSYVCGISSAVNRWPHTNNILMVTNYVWVYCLCLRESLFIILCSIWQILRWPLFLFNRRSRHNIPTLSYYLILSDVLIIFDVLITSDVLFIFDTHVLFFIFSTFISTHLLFLIPVPLSIFKSFLIFIIYHILGIFS